MTGWKIFSHSVFLLNHNLREALRISTPLIGAMILSLVFGGAILVDGIEAGTPSDGGSGALFQILTLVAGLWVAVAWHRFVLLEEYSAALPPFHGKRMLTYFLWGFLIVLLVVLGTSAIGLVIGLLLSAIPPLAAIAMFALLVGAIWVFYRLSPVLPAAAIDQTIGIKGAWLATKPLSRQVLSTAFFLGISGAVGIGFSLLIALQVNIMIGVLLMVAVNWTYSMVGISVLTTIYGIAVEGRSI